jgi:hypothetical protein
VDPGLTDLEKAKVQVKGKKPAKGQDITQKVSIYDIYDNPLEASNLNGLTEKYAK